MIPEILFFAMIGAAALCGLFFLLALEHKKNWEASICIGAFALALLLFLFAKPPYFESFAAPMHLLNFVAGFGAFWVGVALAVPICWFLKSGEASHNNDEE